jgi:hypothetical protein
MKYKTKIYFDQKSAMSAQPHVHYRVRKAYAIILLTKRTANVLLIKSTIMLVINKKES